MAVPVTSSRSVGQVQSDVLPKAQIPAVYAAEGLLDYEST